MAAMATSREISDEAWDRREHDWTGKSFYFVPCIFVFGNPVGLDGKLELLNREVRAANYKIKNHLILIEHCTFKGKIMLEIEKKDHYDAQIHTYDIATSCDTVIHYGGTSSLGKGFDRLREMVASRRSRDPRQMFYLYQPPEATKTILFAIT